MTLREWAALAATVGVAWMFAWVAVRWRQAEAENRRLRMEQIWHPSRQQWRCVCGRVRYTQASSLYDGFGMLHRATGRCEPDLERLTG